MDYNLNLISDDFDIMTATETELIEIHNIYQKISNVSSKGLKTIKEEITKRVIAGEVFENIELIEKPKTKKFTDSVGFIKSLSDVLPKEMLFENIKPSITILKEKYSAYYASKYGTSKQKGLDVFKQLQNKFSESDGMKQELKITNNNKQIKKVN